MGQRETSSCCKNATLVIWVLGGACAVSMVLETVAEVAMTLGTVAGVGALFWLGFSPPDENTEQVQNIQTIQQAHSLQTAQQRVLSDSKPQQGSEQPPSHT